MKKSLAALCITAILFSGSTLLGEERNPGRHWLKMTESERLLWVWGFTEGQQVILDELDIKVRVHLDFLILLKDASAISKIMSMMLLVSYKGFTTGCFILTSANPEPGGDWS